MCSLLVDDTNATLGVKENALGWSRPANHDARNLKLTRIHPSRIDCVFLARCECRFDDFGDALPAESQLGQSQVHWHARNKPCDWRQLFDARMNATFVRHSLSYPA